MTDAKRPLWCTPLQLHYSFELRHGALYLAKGHCCDMRGCIDLFRRIDPAVRSIQTYSDGTEDTYYELDGEWKAKLWSECPGEPKR